MYWNDEQKQAWCAALAAGEVVAAPAEGVYGYCCDPFNEAALKKLITLKQRDENKGMIVLVPSVLELAQLCPPIQDEMLMSIYDHWGVEHSKPTTLIMPARAGVLPQLLTGARATIAVRCPAENYMQEYLQAWGKPLVSTSLNVSGEKPAVTAEGLPKNMPVLALETPLSGTVSRIYDLINGVWVRK